MIAEGIRMKIALVFILMISFVVLTLPFSISGDSSLTGAVQSFLMYGLTATGVLLGMLTIFLSRSLSDELVNRQIYLVVTKPISRWQFILGKWLGIILLNAALVTVAGITMYSMVQYIRYTHPPIDDRYDEFQLNNEILVARHALPVIIPNFTRDAEIEFDRNVEEGLYDDVLDFRPAEEKKRLASKYEAKWRIVGPVDVRLFEFENVLVDRSPGHFIQIRYKTEVTQYPPDEIFRSLWRFGNPYKGTPVYDEPMRHVVGRFHTVLCPSNAVAADHTLTVRFYNQNTHPDEPQYNNVIEFRKSDRVEVLFIVGSFEWNFVRLLILMWCKLIFLAAVALFMATAFSFPVACLGSFTIYILAGTRKFISEALDFSSGDYSSMFDSTNEFFMHSITQLYQMLHWIIPDFARYDAVESFVNGRNVSLVWVLQGVVDLAVIKTVIVLGLAMLLFHRREVAEVSI